MPITYANKRLSDSLARRIYEGHVSASKVYNISVTDLHLKTKSMIQNTNPKEQLTLSYTTGIGDVLHPYDIDIVQCASGPMVLTDKDKILVYQLSYPDSDINLNCRPTDQNEIEKLSYTLLVYRDVNSLVNLESFSEIVLGHRLELLTEILSKCKKVENLAHLL